jgi:hypothetical protein
VKTSLRISLLGIVALSCGHPATLKPDCPTPGHSTRLQTVAPVGLLRGVAEVVPLRERLCVRMVDGTVRCFGGRAGGVGDAACAEYAPLPELHDVAALFADCVRFRDGRLRCWEEPPKGAAPVAAELPSFPGPVRQALNGCAVLESDGRVMCWGERRQLGDVESLIGVEEIGFSSVFKNGCARVFGRVHCWTDEALIGLPQSGAPSEFGRPRRVPGLVDVSQLAVGERFACALSAGQVACFGANHVGQLGDGSRTARLTPQIITGLSGIVQIAAGGERACARTAEGRVACWGALPGPQGTLREQPHPEWVSGLPSARRIAVGPDTLCAIAEDTSLHCWGTVYTPRIPGDVGPALPLAAPASDVDFPRRPPPPPGQLTCSDEGRYHYQSSEGETVYESEDECLDARAWQKMHKQGRCQRVVHRMLRHVRADGAPDWTCECVNGQCRSTDSPLASPSCGEHPETFEPLPPAAITALCRAPVPAKLSGASTKGRMRYCVNGAQPVIGDCRPPPGARGCIPPRGLVPAWRCFVDRSECERSLAEARKAGVRGIDASCAVIPP